MGRVQDKIAVVTGAGNGLGQAIAQRLAEEGARVVLGDIDKEGLDRTASNITAAGGETLALVGDLTEEKQAVQLIEGAVERYGQLDILVNNVGGVGGAERLAKIWEMKAEDWDHILRLNLRTMFLCTRYTVPHMIKRNQGRIICLSSGSREGTPWMAFYSGGSPYSAAKAGVHGFIRAISMELAEYNILVNAVAPGPIDTELAGPGLRQLNETVELSPNRLTPLGRLGEPLEIANTVLFLASKEASYITGQTINVTGGR